MLKKITYTLLWILTIFTIFSFVRQDSPFDVNKSLANADRQVQRTLKGLADTCLMPRSMNNSQNKWSLVNLNDWTSGFWPGILWYDFENTGNKEIKEKAIRYTECLQPLSDPKTGSDHDIGFQLFCSYGNAYRLTGDPHYKQAILQGAEKLSRLYNPKVGTILSWPNMVKKMGWPHNSIIDNMMNLEILFWAARNGGDKKFYNIALSHAKVTQKSQFRPDGSNYHVAVYDTISGNFIKGVTNQGYSDNSMWARGQAWAIYGYTMVYRETRDKSFLRFAEKVTDIYLKRLPKDRVPYWDFDAPGIPNEPKDASAAAIVASALIELAQLEDNDQYRRKYRSEATAMLKTLSSPDYQGGSVKPALLIHCTGNHPSGYEIDASINYGDYYYIEALTRYRKSQNR
ncbi:MAG: glucuronyl hydrolase [Pedobacter sp.]|nr:MAG: glucuronyl hydrolase [Pedobacter sp.]